MPGCCGVVRYSCLHCVCVSVCVCVCVCASVPKPAPVLPYFQLYACALLVLCTGLPCVVMVQMHLYKDGIGSYMLECKLMFAAIW